MATYDLRRYWTTHNSYEGGPRGWLPGQLDRKVRCVELDIWDNDYEQLGDYRLGHLKPGHAVALGNGNPDQNPNTLFLQAWLATLARWSAVPANAGHSVITLVLDVKSDLTDNDRAGDLEDLNQKLETAFGAKLFTRDDYDATPAPSWPDTSQLRDRFIVVLSGDSSSRASYRYCFGQGPAIAANAGGDVVLAYRSGAGDMRCWSGTADAPAGRVRWSRKGTYAWNAFTVSEPSIAINDDGWVVSLHRIGPAPSQPGPALLECSTGRLQADGRIKWFNTETIGDGMAPSLKIDGDDVREIHNTPDGNRRRQRRGTLDRQKRKVEWQPQQNTQANPFPRDTADWQGHQLRCLTNATGMVLCAFDGSQFPVRFRQTAFVELQNQESKPEFVDPRFFGASATDKTAIERERNLGLAARAWWFKDGNQAAPPSPPQENAAATDTPFEQWYDDYMNLGGQAEF